MSFLPYGVAAWLFMIGLYGLASSENLIGMVICLAVLQSAALLAALNTVLPRALTDAASVACALAVTAMCALLTLKTGGLTVYWFGGFHPRAGVAVGISFAVDSIGAGMATLSAFMVSAALVYSVRYSE